MNLVYEVLVVIYMYKYLTFTGTKGIKMSEILHTCSLSNSMSCS